MEAQYKNTNFVFVEKEFKKLHAQYKEEIVNAKATKTIDELQLSEHEEQTDESDEEGLEKMDFNERLTLPKELRRMFWMRNPDEEVDRKKEPKGKEKQKKEVVAKVIKETEGADKD